MLLGPHVGVLLAYLLTIATASIPGLAAPLLIRQIIDKALPQGDGWQLNLLALAMFVLIMLGSLLGVLQSYLSNSISQTIMFDLRKQLYMHLSGMSLRWFTTHRTGETISRISNDVGAVQGVVGDTFGNVVGNVITLGSTFALMLVLDWRLAVISALALPVFILAAQRVGNLQRSLQRETQEQLGALNSQMQETLSVNGALLLKVFGRQAAEAQAFTSTAQRIRSLNLRRAMIGRWFGMAMGLFGAIGPVVVYWYGGHRVIGAEATTGTVVALAALLPRLFGPIASLASINTTVLSSLALFERIFDYLDLEQEIKEKPDAVELRDARGEIELRDVQFSYIKGQPVLKGVSMVVPAGKFAALVGATGAGKTTIAHLVPRLYDVDSGQVLIDGHDVRDLSLDSLARCLGLVDQEPFLFHASIRDNLRVAQPAASDEEIEAVTHAANIDQFIERLPDGYDTVVGERGYRLSGGEKQRVAIARALLKDPAILILDEATSSVDTLTEAAIQEALARLTRGRTVLAIAHRLSTVLAADIIFVIDDGKVAEQGTHAELVAAGGLYSRLYQRQFGLQPV